MQSIGSLSPAQKSVLVSTYHTLESMATYIRAVVPCVSGTDEQLLSGLAELAEMCLKRLPHPSPSCNRSKRAGKAGCAMSKVKVISIDRKPLPSRLPRMESIEEMQSTLIELRERLHEQKQILRQEMRERP